MVMRHPSLSCSTRTERPWPSLLLLAEDWLRPWLPDDTDTEDEADERWPLELLAEAPTPSPGRSTHRCDTLPSA